MDQVTQVKRRLHSEQWKRLISECQSSGMTIKAWCRQNGICEQTYYRNLKKIRQELCASLPVLTADSEKPAIFQKLEVQPPVIGTKAAVTIHLPAAVIEVQNGADQQTVEAVLLALKNIC